jgi:hypothetical protein
VAIGKDFNKQMLALHLRTNKKETVVGWYASAALGEDDTPGATPPDLISEVSSLIHEFYAGESDEGDPIHLVVDTRLIEDAITARAGTHGQHVPGIAPDARKLGTRNAGPAPDGHGRQNRSGWGRG